MHGAPTPGTINPAAQSGQISGSRQVMPELLAAPERIGATEAALER